MPTDEEFHLGAAALHSAIEEDVANGKIPFFVESYDIILQSLVGVEKMVNVENSVFFCFFLFVGSGIRMTL
jgi:hypothetical protein